MARKWFDADKLLYRRQFVLGPRFLTSLPSWKRIRLRDGICISAHPDLDTWQVAREGRSITLLGYILDPNRPDDHDSAILDNLLTDLVDGAGSWMKSLETLGGRWILIVDDGEEVRLLNDPIGTRQVFYTDVSMTKDLWCATQPGIIAEALQLRMDPVAVNEYVESDVFRQWPLYLWPADTSPYREIVHLLPNHFLNLSTGMCSRFWPDGRLGELSLQEAAQISSELLTGLMRSASRRFDLAHLLSAGWDSRLLLAASKDLCRRIDYFTFRLRPTDVATTPKLLSRLGLNGRMVRLPDRMSSEFAELHRRNVTLAHDFWGRCGQALLDSYPRGSVCVTGDAAEITRVRFRLPKGEEKVTARSLARFTSFHAPDQMEKIPFVMRAWEKWLSRLGNTFNVHVLDLFYWEHWGGNFAAMDLAEADMVFESFPPYSCRTLLTTMLSTDEALRDHDDPILYRATINNLWPEVLSVPVNPEPRPDWRSLVRKSEMYQLAKRRLGWIRGARARRG